MKTMTGDFPGGPVVKTPCFHCSGHGFDPRSGKEDPTCRVAWPRQTDKQTKQWHVGLGTWESVRDETDACPSPWSSGCKHRATLEPPGRRHFSHAVLRTILADPWRNHRLSNSKEPTALTGFHHKQLDPWVYEVWLVFPNVQNRGES